MQGFVLNHFWFLGKSIYGILAQSHPWKAICMHGKHVAWSCHAEKERSRKWGLIVMRE